MSPDTDLSLQQTTSNPSSPVKSPPTATTTTTTGTTKVTTTARPSPPPKYRPPTILYQPQQQTANALRPRVSASSSGDITEMPGEPSRRPVSLVSSGDVKKWIRTGSFGQASGDEGGPLRPKSFVKDQQQQRRENGGERKYPGVMGGERK